MALPENVPTVSLELDRTRRLAFTLGAMRRIKEATGRSITVIQSAGEEEMLEHIGACVWAMLVNEDRADVEVADVEEMIHPGNLNAVIEAFSDLVSGAQQDVEEAGVGSGNPTRRRKK